MRKHHNNLEYTLIPLANIHLAGLVTIWTITDLETEKSIGFAVSSYRNQTTPEGRHATPLKWGWVACHEGLLSGVDFIYESREEAGQSLKEQLEILPVDY